MRIHGEAKDQIYLSPLSKIKNIKQTIGVVHDAERLVVTEQAIGGNDRTKLCQILKSWNLYTNHREMAHLQHPANRTNNPQLHTRPATWKPQHEIPQAATTV